MDKEDKIKSLEEELEKTKQELIETKEHLKKYTAPSRSKTYYENHKEEILERVKKYPLTKEQIKEKNKKALLKRKLKEENEKIIKSEII
jgi:hypothetical protein